ncbi:hypothetical protein ACXDBX_000770, partial [Cronobacter sakazakii]
MTSILGAVTHSLNAHSCLSLAHFSLPLEEIGFFAHTERRLKGLSGVAVNESRCNMSEYHRRN